MEPEPAKEQEPVTEQEPVLEPEPETVPVPELERRPQPVPRRVSVRTSPQWYRWLAPRWPRIDWGEVKLSLCLVGEGLRELVCLLALWCQEAGLVSARFAFFGLVTFTIGVHTLSEVSNDRPLFEWEEERRELAARALVENFLENGQLRQLSKARMLLAPELQSTVSEDELADMFGSLPLYQDPESWELRFSGGGLEATVCIARAGGLETYLLRREGSGWRLLSVKTRGIPS